MRLVESGIQYQRAGGESDSPRLREASLCRAAPAKRSGGGPSGSVRRAFLSVLSAALTAIGCVSDHSTIAPYRDDPDAAAEIEDRATILCLDRTAAIPPHPFTTDGCSVFPDGDWQDCCVEHDLDYWCGGSSSERERADHRLATCVERAGHPTLGPLMRIGVRMGGVPWWPLPWRWGYGWDYPHGYDPEQSVESPKSRDHRERVTSTPSPAAFEHEGSPD